MTNILLLAAAFAVFMALAVFWYKALRYTPEESVAMAAAFIMLAVLAAGLLGSTRIAVYVICALALLGAAMLFSGTAVRKKGLASRLIAHDERGAMGFFSPGAVFVCVMFAAAIVLFYNGEILYIDEANMWAPSVKYMAANDLLPVGTGFWAQSVIASSTSFFHYFFTAFTGYAESSLYVSQWVLIMAAVMLPMSGNGWKSWYRTFLYGAIVFFALSFLYTQPYWNIMTDEPVALWMGSIVAWLMLRGMGERRQLLFYMALMAAAAMKSEVGVLFAVMVAFIYVVISCKRRCAGVEGGLKARIAALPRGKTVLEAAKLIVLPLLAVFIWKLISAGVLVRGAAANAVSRDLNYFGILKDMAAVAFKPIVAMNDYNLDYIYNVSYFAFIVIAAAALFFLLWQYRRDKAQRSIIKTCGLLYMAGFVLYFFAVYYMYLTTFSLEEVGRMASLERYFSLYMMIGLAALLAPVFAPQAHFGRGAKIVAIVLCVVIALGLQPTAAQRFTSWYQAGNTKNKYEIKTQLEKDYPKIEKATGGEGKIYIIAQKCPQNTRAYARYISDNQTLLVGPTTFRADQTPYPTTPPRTVLDHAIDELAEVWEKYDAEYLWIIKTNDYATAQLKAQFGIEAKSNSLYRIVRDKGGARLVEMDY